MDISHVRHLFDDDVGTIRSDGRAVVSLDDADHLLSAEADATDAADAAEVIVSWADRYLRLAEQR